ncbi:MAG: hypothetical protein E7628_00010 [Ruminococcaceae bacterium]|nr:hypothetical protein [Oscillospiraceae bacterium]
MPKKYGRHKKLYERISHLCEVDADIVAALPVFIIRGEHEIEVEGCRGILEYEPEKVVLSVKNGRFTALGQCLTLSDFRSGVLYIRGNIKAAYFGDMAAWEGETC